MNPELLLENADWLRHLARGLIHDEHHAEDVIQETWLAVLDQRPQPTHPRAWLGTVVRHQARKVMRRERRRSQRERRVARAEALPADGADMDDQLRLQRRLVEAVIDLDEPFRLKPLSDASLFSLSDYSGARPALGRCAGISLTP